MKNTKSIFFIFFILFTVGLNAQSGIEFYKGSVEEAMILAKDTGKPLFIEAYADWCGPCRLMARDTFSDDEVAAYFNENFVNVKLDVDRGGRNFANAQGIRSIPHFIFMNSEGEKVLEKKGFYAPHLFLKVGEKAVKKANR